jgi:hypothetical protein
MRPLRRKLDQDWKQTLHGAEGRMGEGWQDIVFQGRLSGS